LTGPQFSWSDPEIRANMAHTPTGVLRARLLLLL
jgi:hypothetical protein